MTVTRTGIDLFSLDWGVTAESIKRFPEGSSYGSFSWGNLLLAKLFGVESPTTWFTIHIFLTIACLVIPLALANKLPRASFFPFTIYWLLLPGVGSILMWIGMYDVVSVLGAVVLALSRSWWVAFIGALIWSSGNPEQAVIGALIFLVMSGTNAMSERRTVAAVGLLTTGAALIASRLFISLSDAPSRSGLLRPVGQGLQQLIYNWPQSIWGLNGILWFFLLAVFFSSRWRDRLLLIVSLVAVPLAAMLVTYDWYRIYWLLTTAALVALGHKYCQQLASRSPSIRGAVLATGFLALLIVPATSGGLFFLLSAIGEFLT